MAEKNQQAVEVKIFSTTWCGYCKMAKAYFASKNIKTVDVNIEEEPDAAAWLEERNLRGVPVILFNKEDIVHGFDRPKIDLLIRQHKLD